ncbi:hypothetical protein [Paenisporosarcina cavernae]|uniref:Amino acid transporter n=1 Tax=Paenisporosarcina cavernae TaxID=2320858 RepID=A0A385YR43_9BACL|nr:hypothetical protein [Paenisporosarcina cavernae]AYC28467.1 hypothetical protein D3873_00740 [Paenisporosarcina cavernae]
MAEKTKPFNDAIDHLAKIEGSVGNVTPETISKLPTPVKVVAYVLFGLFALGVVFTFSYVLISKWIH